MDLVSAFLVAYWVLVRILKFGWEKSLMQHANKCDTQTINRGRDTKRCLPSTGLDHWASSRISSSSLSSDYSFLRVCKFGKLKRVIKETKSIRGISKPLLAYKIVAYGQWTNASQRSWEVTTIEAFHFHIIWVTSICNQSHGSYWRLYNSGLK